MSPSSAPWSPFNAPVAMEMAFLVEHEMVSTVLETRAGKRGYLETLQNTPIDFRGSVSEVQAGAVYPLMWLDSDQKADGYGNEPLPSGPDQKAIKARVTGRNGDKIAFEVMTDDGHVVGRLSAIIQGTWSLTYTGPYVPYSVVVGGLKLMIGSFTPATGTGEAVSGPLPPPNAVDCANECAGRGGCTLITNTTSLKNPQQQVTMVICANGDVLESPTGQPPFALADNISGLSNLDVF